MRDPLWRKHPAERDVYSLDVRGCEWELRKRTTATPPGWWLYGIDRDGSITAGVWMGSSVGAAKGAAEQWIFFPADRETLEVAP